MLIFASLSSNAMTVNHLNGGGSVMYFDFNIPGPSMPLEVVRYYHSMTALSEKRGWKGAFGWGWTAPFESVLVSTPDRQVILRDGNTGNTLVFKSQEDDPKVLETFVSTIKRQFYEESRGRKLSDSELSTMKLPASMEKRIRTDSKYRARMATKYKVELTSLTGQILVSTEYGYQTIQLRSNRWYREHRGTTLIFDDRGRLVRQQDKNGFYFDFIYPSQESFQLSEMRDANKALSVKFQWERGHVVKIEDNRRNKATYQYDEMENLIGATDSAGHVYRYVYGNKRFPHLITKIEYPQEKVGMGVAYREFRHDTDGLIVYQRDKNGAQTEYTYGRSSTDPENQFWTRLTTIEGENKTEAYDQFSLKKRADGSKYLYKQVTKQGPESLSTIYSECCGQPLEIDQNGQVTRFKYTPEGLTQERSTKEGTIRFEYDPKWKKPSKVIEAGLVSIFQYDTHGNLKFASNSKKSSVTLAYDSYGRVQSMTNAAGMRLDFEYDDKGKPKRITEVGTGALELTYAPSGRLVRVQPAGDRTPTATRTSAKARRIQGAFQAMVEILRPAGFSEANL